VEKLAPHPVIVVMVIVKRVHVKITVVETVEKLAPHPVIVVMVIVKRVHVAVAMQIAVRG